MLPEEIEPPHQDYPLPQRRPASEKEPIDFETAKGCVAHYASVAARAIENYYSTHTGNELPEGIKKVSGTLRKMAKEAYNAASPQNWQYLLKGNKVNGSGRIGHYMLALNAIGAILHYDNKLETGILDDPAETLTRSSLEKLKNGLMMGYAGIREYTDPNDPSFRPFSNSKGGNVSTGFKHALLGAIHAHCGERVVATQNEFNKFKVFASERAID